MPGSGVARIHCHAVTAGVERQPDRMAAIVQPGPAKVRWRQPGAQLQRIAARRSIVAEQGIGAVASVEHHGIAAAAPGDDIVALAGMEQIVAGGLAGEVVVAVACSLPGDDRPFCQDSMSAACSVEHADRQLLATRPAIDDQFLAAAGPQHGNRAAVALFKQHQQVGSIQPGQRNRNLHRAKVAVDNPVRTAPGGKPHRHCGELVQIGVVARAAIKHGRTAKAFQQVGTGCALGIKDGLLDSCQRQHGAIGKHHPVHTLRARPAANSRASLRAIERRAVKREGFARVMDGHDDRQRIESGAGKADVSGVEASQG